MNGGSLKRHDTVAKGPWVWGLCSLDSGPGVGGANVHCPVVHAKDLYDVNKKCLFHCITAVEVQYTDLGAVGFDLFTYLY
jgi:hypothetical protein